eukprot:906097-Rhodomonas_salina.1
MSGSVVGYPTTHSVVTLGSRLYQVKIPYNLGARKETLEEKSKPEREEDERETAAICLPPSAYARAMKTPVPACRPLVVRAASCRRALCTDTARCTGTSAW